MSQLVMDWVSFGKRYHAMIAKGATANDKSQEQRRIEEYFSAGVKDFPEFLPGWNMIFPGRNFHYGTHQTNFSGFKKLGKKKVLIFHTSSFFPPFHF